MVRVSPYCHRELTLLRLAWNKGNLSEVIEELLKPHHLEKIKAIGIQAPEDSAEVRAQD